MSTRIARSVFSAHKLSEKPSCIPTGRPRGARAAGIRYEKAFGKAIGQAAEHGPWFQFKDLNGNGYCQPDYLIELEHLVVILECKYTWTAQAYAQMELLYIPVLKVALGKPVIGLQVCKRLLPEATLKTKIVGMLGNGLILANQGQRVTLHWLENTPVSLVPTSDQIQAIQAAKSREMEQVHG